MKVTKIEDYLYSVCFSEQELHSYKFVFDGNEFYFYKAIEEFQSEFALNPRQEILPGTWVTDVNRYFQQRSQHGLKAHLKKMLAIIFGYQFNLEIRNRRNNYNFGEIESYKKPSPEYVPPLFPEGHYDTTIDPQIVAYPDSMGRGASRCIIWDIFNRLGLFDTFHYDYNMYSLDEIIENITRNKRMLDFCKRQKSCMVLLDKFQNNTYDTNNNSPSIRISYYNGSYDVSDGNHRICVARRFRVNSVPVQLTVTHTSDAYEPSQYYSYIQPSCKAIMKEYHDNLKPLALTKEQGQYLLETPIQEIDIIGYLEEVKGKSISEILENIQ